jgi:hypothetical protein
MENYHRPSRYRSCSSSSEEEGNSDEEPFNEGDLLDWTYFKTSKRLNILTVQRVLDERFSKPAQLFVAMFVRDRLSMIFTTIFLSRVLMNQKSHPPKKLWVTNKCTGKIQSKRSCTIAQLGFLIHNFVQKLNSQSRPHTP